MSKYMNQSLQYVAFSRVTKADGLYILNKYFFPPSIKVNDPLLLEMKRLESTATPPIFEFVHQNQENCGFQIIFHNVQSLQAHHLDIAKDPCFMASDFLLFSETWSLPRDHIEFPNFYKIVEIPSSESSERKHSGVCIYAKKDIPILKYEMFPDYSADIHIAVVYLQNNIRLAVLYAKPQSSTDYILDTIEDALGYDCHDYKSILAGDFNINLTTEDGKDFCNSMRNGNKLHLKTNPVHWTTRGRTTLDAIFSSHDLKCSGVYDSTFSSFHIPLYARMYK